MQKKLQKLNEYFYQNACWGNLSAPNVFTYHKGKYSTCFCAPHSVCSFVKKQEKKSDLYTGAIVSYLGKECGFSTIVRDKFVHEKNMISTFILDHKLTKHFFLDIHGMRKMQDVDLIVGTGYLKQTAYQSVLQKIATLCKKYDIKYRVNVPNYMGQIGLTGRLQKATGKANVLQLEFSPALRDIDEALVQQKTIPFLIELGKFCNKL